MIKNNIEEYLQDPLSLKLLEGIFKEKDKVLVELDINKNIAFKAVNNVDKELIRAKITI